jgi:hypothetical protein
MQETSFAGRGDVLFIQVHGSKVDEYALRELLALFWRYGVDMKQLAVFDKQEFAHWFHKRTAYWHKSVFGAGRPLHRADDRRKTQKATS